MSAEIRALKLEFEVPKNFLNPEKYLPEPLPNRVLADVPDVIMTAVFEVMDIDVPIDPFNTFMYLRNGRLPEFVVVYFMNLVSRHVKSNMSRFFTALHLIQMYREYIINPPSHIMAPIDTAAVHPAHSMKTEAAKLKEDKKEEKEDGDNDKE